MKTKTNVKAGKLVDVASPKLYLVCANGKHITP